MTSVKAKKIWYRCSNCNQKLLKYDEIKGKSQKLFIRCKQCKKEIEIKIE